MHEFCTWSNMSGAESSAKSVNPSRQDLMTLAGRQFAHLTWHFADLIWDEFAVVFRQRLLIP